MPHRELLTESQRLSLQAPASDERGMVRHYMLSSEDLAILLELGRYFHLDDDEAIAHDDALEVLDMLL